MELVLLCGVLIFYFNFLDMSIILSWIDFAIRFIPMTILVATVIVHLSSANIPKWLTKNQLVTDEPKYPYRDSISDTSWLASRIDLALVLLILMLLVVFLFWAPIRYPSWVGLVVWIFLAMAVSSL